MDNARLSELLRPFLGATEPPLQLLDQLQIYLELLLRWNQRVNLTSVRDPEQIVTRHFGESLFAAQALASHSGRDAELTRLADIGSGGGFPGIPMKVLLPHLHLTLIESQNKKATFLREVVRALRLENATVFCGRAEHWQNTADVVTLRAVEQFERVLPVAASLVDEHGLLCLLIGGEQIQAAHEITPGQWKWFEPVPVPDSASRSIVIAQRLT